MNKEIRLRFAPSPTGYLHIGSLRTVLFTYLIARHEGGKLILRVEDTDQKREVEGATEKLIEVLSELGFELDEGPHVGGEYGPYTQSERLEIYNKHLTDLLSRGGAYRCFCSAERLEKMRADQQANKLPPRYDRTCRDISPEESDRRAAAGEPFVIRQKMPLIGEITVNDELHGEIKFKSEDMDDQVLIKTNGVPTYQYASVIDDHEMKISHVTRADEWLPSFPKNYLLYESFGWEAPKFIHYPVILNKDGKGKLSKRQGDVAVEDFLLKGYLKEALINFCALLGWHPKGDNEILSLDDLVREFDYRSIGTSPAYFDTDKLDYLNGYYIRQKPIAELTTLCLPYLINAGLIKQGDLEEKYINAQTGEELSLAYMEKIVTLEQERMKKLSEIPELTNFIFAKQLNYPAEMLVWKKMEKENVRPNLVKLFEMLAEISESDWTKELLEEKIIAYIKENNQKVGEYLWPMRVSLTGKEASPGPFEVAEVLGKNKTITRIDFAISLL